MSFSYASLYTRCQTAARQIVYVAPDFDVTPEGFDASTALLSVGNTVQYYPSLTEWGRQRLQFNPAVKREVLKNFYIGVNAYDTFDSAPPNPDAARNDVGVVASIGWSFGR